MRLLLLGDLILDEPDPDSFFEPSLELLRSADLVVGRAQRSGLLRDDITGADLMQLMGPMCTSPTLTEEQGKRLLGLVLDGLRVTARS